MSTMTQEQAGSALHRLSPEQRAQLDNLQASFRMERMEPTAAELELGARYLLDEISFEDLQAGLADLP
jgi:hypothetical protein